MDFIIADLFLKIREKFNQNEETFNITTSTFFEKDNYYLDSIKNMESCFHKIIAPLIINGSLTTIDEKFTEIRDDENIIEKEFVDEKYVNFGRYKNILCERFKVTSPQNITSINVYSRQNLICTVEGNFKNEPNGICLIKKYYDRSGEHFFSRGVFVDGKKEGVFFSLIVHANDVIKPEAYEKYYENGVEIMVVHSVKNNFTGKTKKAVTFDDYAKNGIYSGLEASYDTSDKICIEIKNIKLFFSVKDGQVKIVNIESNRIENVYRLSLSENCVILTLKLDTGDITESLTFPFIKNIIKTPAKDVSFHFN